MARSPAALEQPGWQIWVDRRRTRPTSDRQPILWLWFSDTALRRRAALRGTADAHAVSVIGS